MLVPSLKTRLPFHKGIAWIRLVGPRVKSRALEKKRVCAQQNKIIFFVFHAGAVRRSAHLWRKDEGSGKTEAEKKSSLLFKNTLLG